MSSDFYFYFWLSGEMVIRPFTKSKNFGGDGWWGIGMCLVLNMPIRGAWGGGNAVDSRVN